MKKLKQCIFILCASYFIFGCVSLQEANDERKTLVIGILNYQGTGFTNNFTGMNGIKRMDIELTMQELASEETVVLKSNSNGMFFSTILAEGQYKVTRLYYKGPLGATTVWRTPSSVEHKVEIINDRVNNLGTIIWEREYTVVNPNEVNRISYNKEYEQVRDLFNEKNKSSNWNEKEWIDTKLVRESK